MMMPVQTNKPTDSSKRKVRILIVDDEPDVTLALKIGLEYSGFILADIFNNPVLALEKFRKRVYDLIILDINMPYMNGFELYAKLRNIDTKVRVYFLTALSDFQDYEEFRKQAFPKDGQSYFIQKPIAIDDLIKELRIKPR
jgi:two-component system, OmpR family, response regulator ChvI